MDSKVSWCCDLSSLRLGPGRIHLDTWMQVGVCNFGRLVFWWRSADVRRHARGLLDIGRQRQAGAFKELRVAVTISSPPILGSSTSVCGCGSCCIYPMSFWPCNPSGLLNSQRSGKLDLLPANNATIGGSDKEG